MSMKIKRTHIFFLSMGLVIAELLPFSFFYIISLWKLVNKISQEPLELDRVMIFGLLILRFCLFLFCLF